MALTLGRWKVQGPSVCAVAPEEREPDYRFTLANERTFLAWLRTALALLAAAVAVVQLVPRLDVPGARKALGLVLVLLSLSASGGSVLRWRAVERAMRRDEPLPRVRTTWILACGLCLVALVAGVVIATGPVR